MTSTLTDEGRGTCEITARCRLARPKVGKGGKMCVNEWRKQWSQRKYYYKKKKKNQKQEGGGGEEKKRPIVKRRHRIF